MEGSDARILFEERGEKLTLWIGEMDDIAIFLEHIDLLNGLDGLDVQLLEGGLEFLVVGAGGFVDLLDFSSRCAFTPVIDSLFSIDYF